MDTNSLFEFPFELHIIMCLDLEYQEVCDYSKLYGLNVFESLVAVKYKELYPSICKVLKYHNYSWDSVLENIQNIDYKKLIDINNQLMDFNKTYCSSIYYIFENGEGIAYNKEFNELIFESLLCYSRPKYHEHILSLDPKIRSRVSVWSLYEIATNNLIKNLSIFINGKLDEQLSIKDIINIAKAAYEDDDAMDELLPEYRADLTMVLLSDPKFSLCGLSQLIRDLDISLLECGINITCHNDYTKVLYYLKDLKEEWD
jgi:hypothetical protein